ncbi:hypothetical protein QFZ63_002094 [Streptomyces sp. B3I7]|uniref:sugar kinase n=1 Tax=unclassified Streptomyces TaxID=2593676 RepID=UPI0027869CE7|nr:MULTISPECIES: sugar kinase [unclassified Streptomyces]MDQ0790014.1 hypothetical protein [Streptomyces sp. B3I8]MDQ0810380.1 hypothetical protein [Streptomyces sp. B3I7]
MTSAAVPHQPLTPQQTARTPENRRHMIRRRAFTLLTIVLLIGVPAGYLVISANQSRDSGKQKEEKWSATGLTAGWPSLVQRRLYQVPVPPYSRDVAYYETNNWKTSRLYTQFLTSNEGLERFLRQTGTEATALKMGDVAIGTRDQQVIGWSFSGPGPWYGLVHKQKSPSPTHDIVVNRSDPAHPMVYVVSRTVP